MQPDVPFPIAHFNQRVQESILEEFGGRCPSASELAQIPDSRLLKLPGFGPKTLRRIRSLTQGWSKIPEIAAPRLSTRLHSELDHLEVEIGVLQDEFHRRQMELRCKLDLLTSQFLSQHFSFKDEA